jgi:Rab11 family-interacting protein 3/4
MNPESKKNYLEFGSGLWAYDDFNTEEDDQLWFDTWEGQIELSQDSSSPKKPQSINDLLLEAEDDFDEFSVLSPSFLQKTPQGGSSSAFLRQASLPAALFSSEFGNNFHSAHTLFWNQHSRDSSSEDVQMLQEQVGHLAESQQTTDDRYSKVKQENATLTQKVHMLEEHIREIELQSQERLIEEQKRHKELVQRLEREKALELENFSIKLQSAEREHASTHRDLTSLRSQVDRLKTEKGQLEQELFETQQSYSLLQSEYSKLEDNLKKTHDLLQKDRSDNAHIVEELTKEVETLREQLRRSRSEDEEHVILINNQNANKPGNSEHNKVSSSLNPESNVGSRAKEMEAELKSLRDQTRKLKEEKEDLQAQVEFSTINGGVIAGRNVLQSAASISIADELGSLSDNQVRNALKEQQDVNASLRGYIDGILTNIIEKYPELLEISCKK